MSVLARSHWSSKRSTDNAEKAGRFAKSCWRRWVKADNLTCGTATSNPASVVWSRCEILGLQRGSVLHDGRTCPAGRSPPDVRMLERCSGQGRYAPSKPEVIANATALQRVPQSHCSACQCLYRHADLRDGQGGRCRLPGGASTAREPFLSISNIPANCVMAIRPGRGTIQG